MREKYEKFLQFCSIFQWEDPEPGVFDGVSNDEFPISLAVIFTVFRRLVFGTSIVDFRNCKKI